ncbi:MAG: cell division protein FtsZ [Thermoplasmatales archaeon]
MEMTNQEIAKDTDQELIEILKTLKTNIKIIGCGGSGSNTISRIMEEGITGADVIAANTDAQHLLLTQAPRKILLGKRLTRGLGAGAIPQIGEQAAREAEDEIRSVVEGADIVFVTAGMGGGTGTGSAHVVAELAKQAGALVIAVVTLPFTSEGKMRMENALWGLQKLKEKSDTVIVIPNDKLLQIVPRLPLNEAFRFADEILMNAIKGLTELITKPGLVNLDFNDLRTVMKDGGSAMIGIGQSGSQQRALDAAKKALTSPLLESDISTATSAIVSVTGSSNMSVEEAHSVLEEVKKAINPNARIIWGARIDESMKNDIKVLTILVGAKNKYLP